MLEQKIGHMTALIVISDGLDDFDHVKYEDLPSMPTLVLSLWVRWKQVRYRVVTVMMKTHCVTRIQKKSVTASSTVATQRYQRTRSTTTEMDSLIAQLYCGWQGDESVQGGDDSDDDDPILFPTQEWYGDSDSDGFGEDGDVQSFVYGNRTASCFKQRRL